VEQAALDHLQQLVEDEVRARFPGAPVQRVAVLQYGDDPVVEPGELIVRVILATDGAADDGDARKRALDDFHDAFEDELEKFWDDLSRKLPEARTLEFLAGDGKTGRHIRLGRGPRSIEARALAGAELTPVMARLGPADLETLDTLITAGIAANRADAVRWALARIRERPAYEQLRVKKREIDELKAQF
jgi:hypothetical protein